MKSSLTSLVTFGSHTTTTTVTKKEKNRPEFIIYFYGVTHAQKSYARTHTHTHTHKPADRHDHRGLWCDTMQTEFLLSQTHAEKKSSDITVSFSVMTVVPLCSCPNIKNCIHDKIHIPLPFSCPPLRKPRTTVIIFPLCAQGFIFLFFFTRVSPPQLLNTDGVFKAHQCWRVARATRPSFEYWHKYYNTCARDMNFTVKR